MAIWFLSPLEPQLSLERPTRPPWLTPWLGFGFLQASMREEHSSWNHKELAGPVGKGFVGSSFALVKVGHSTLNLAGALVPRWDGTS